MDAVELLAREDEFKRLNKQLEKKTESLMREIEHVMVSLFVRHYTFYSFLIHFRKKIFIRALSMRL